MLPVAHRIDLVAGVFSDTSVDDLRQLVLSLESSPAKNNLVLHFHGGLVSRQWANDNANQTLLPAYQSAGAYPIFTIWNSDIWTTISANLDAILQDPAFLRLIRRLVQFVVSLIGPDMELRATTNIAWVDLSEVPRDPEQLERYLAAHPRVLPADLTPQQRRQFEEELAQDPILSRIETRLAHGANSAATVLSTAAMRGTMAGGFLATRLSPSILAEIQATTTAPADARAGLAGAAWVLGKFGVKVLVAVLKRYAQGRQHGLYDTIVQETLRTLYLENLGVPIWNAMKNNTRDAFGDDPTRYGGAALLEALKKRIGPNGK